ncbi:MAG TPA: response regulator [Polyangiaceae bacterium]|nr:response regulator [Polyangiaceae bacterium]
MTRPLLRILLVEDDEEDFLLTGRLLRRNDRTAFEVTWVTTSTAALRELKNPYDACLVDYRLGADTGVSFIQQAISQGFRGPLVLLTGRGDHDIDAEAMRAGAADYLVKDEMTGPLIERVLRHAVERKQAEAALRRTEEQLRQAQKMEAMGSLAGGVAHDFNNLLSIVLSYSELCAEGLKDGDPIREDLKQITEAGLRAAGLTRQLLAFSHQQVLDPVVLDLNEVFGKIEQMLRRLIGEDVEFASNIDRDLRRIKADPGQVEQIIMNLVVNARDAMPQGGKLTVATSHVTLDEEYASRHIGVNAGMHVLLTVSDTGTGMAGATLARIFDPFFTTKEPGKGTGLGLATVFGIVRQSGGSICVDSEIGVGTSFKIHFPVVEGALGRRRSDLPTLDRLSLFGTETVLLVEDDERVRSLVRAIVLKFGYVVLEAQSAGDAFLLAEQHEGAIDLLLTDVVMPRMSGRQLADRLMLERPEMKVLYMSGYTNDAVVRHGVSNTTIAFIQKPLTPEPLMHKIREVLDAESVGLLSGVMPVALSLSVRS